MTSRESEIYYDVVYEDEIDATEGQRRAAILKTRSLLGQWRSRFTDESIDPQKSKERPVTLGSASPTEAVAKVTAPDGSWLIHELSGEEGNLVVTVYPVGGEPRVIEGDFVSQHDDLARIIFDFDHELRRG